MNNDQNPSLRPHPAAALSSQHVAVEELVEAQDATLMQIMAIAKLAKAAIDIEADDATDNAGNALAAIIKLAAVATEQLDLAMLEIGDARAARCGLTEL